ncbi:MAG: hypothetical protein KKG59_07845 [Nanoarchaeota archaeon]|nr:hypothetical protein [Nanoarchaeota archaeon]
MVWIKRTAPLLSYFAIIIGLYFFHNAWAAFLMYHVGILLILLKEGEFKDIHWLAKGWNNMWGFALIVFGIAGGALIFFLWPFLQVDKSISLKLAAIGLTGASWLGFVIYHSLINSWFEEFFWRGYFGSPSQKPHPTDFLFAGYHLFVLYLFLAWQWLILAFVILVVAAWLWRIMVLKHKGLLVPVASHIAADGAIMLVLFLLV